MALAGPEGPVLFIGATVGVLTRRKEMGANAMVPDADQTEPFQPWSHHPQCSPSLVADHGVW
jgi:hypothetical protein